MLLPTTRSGRGAAYYNLLQLFQFIQVPLGKHQRAPGPPTSSLLRSSGLRSAGKLKRTLEGVMALIFGDTAVSVAAPSAPTLSRAKAKVDVALMLIRRDFWSKAVKSMSIQLGCLVESCLFPVYHRLRRHYPQERNDGGRRARCTVPRQNPSTQLPSSAQTNCHRVIVGLQENPGLPDNRLRLGLGSLFWFQAVRHDPRRSGD